MRALLEKLIVRKDLTREEAARAMGFLMSGQAPEAVIGAFLATLAAKGETVDEIVGAAEAMRACATPIRCETECIDTCGAGGDGISTFNVSTAAAIIAAAAGATVAKHGNVTNTRVSGSAEVLQALGVNIHCSPAVVERSLSHVRLGFLFARTLHPAMQHAAAARRALGVRTIFNLLGPLTNPARVRRQVLGVPRPELTEKMAEVLRRLGAVRVMVIHGLDGLCDLTVTAETRVTELHRGAIRTWQLRPEDVDLPRATLEPLMVASPQESADAIRRVLSGEPGPRRHHALLNAAAALVVADLAEDLRHGLQLAAAAIDDGRGRETLRRLIEVTHA
ncbi:MAG: anthranilate phosphoribosyltransferase [Planctomycetota bacterium]